MVSQDEVQRIFSSEISQLHAAESTEGGHGQKKVRIKMAHACACRCKLTYSKARGRCLQCARVLYNLK